MFNLHFFYKYTIRYISYLKDFNINFYNKILKINKLIVYFNCNSITDINNNSILSSIFFFKFYFGVIPIFSNYKSVFKLNVFYYSFFIEYIFSNKNVFFPFLFFLNDIYGYISKAYIKINFNINFWEFYINDMNFFLEKRNSLGFFNLKYKLFFKFIFNLNNNLFNLFKIKNFI